MHLYFVYFHFSRKGDILWIFVQYFLTFYCILEVFVLYCPVFREILYCIPVLLKKIALGGLQRWAAVTHKVSGPEGLSPIKLQDH